MLFFGRKKSSVFKGVSQQLAVLVLLAMAFFFFLGLRDSQAAFELNFEPAATTGQSYITSGWVDVSCNMSYIADSNCSSDGYLSGSGAHRDGSAFFQKLFEYGGKRYYHVIVGDKNVDSFFMEYMIESDSNWGAYSSGGMGGCGSYCAASASAGSTASGASGRTYNMINPYGADSSLGGTGTGNPNRVIMRQVLDDGITYSEFLKGAGDADGDGLYDDSSAYFDKKPLIVQKINEPGVVSAEYSLDMRSKTYSDTTPVSEAEKTNQTFILDGLNAANQGDYDSTGATQTPTNMSDSTGVVVDGGAYKYTDGPSFGGSYGGYTYFLSDGVTEKGVQTQPYDRDYSVFCIESQNVDWSGNGACVNGNGSGGGRGGGMGGWGGW